MKRSRRIQLLIDPHLDYFREVILGSLREMELAGSLQLADRWLEHELRLGMRHLIQRDNIGGLVVSVHDATRERAFLQLCIPVVNISHCIQNPKLSVVTQDDEEVGRMAALHLRSLGCKAHAFWGDQGRRYSEERLKGFESELGAVLQNSSREHVESPGHTFDRMRRFLRGLPERTGLFCALDSQALMALRALRELGRKVPEDIAVLGAGDDPFLLEMESIPLSSLRLPARSIGREAIRLLSAPARQRKGIHRVPGVELKIRRSTDVQHLEDPVFVRAMRHLQQSPEARVHEVVQASGASRGALQKRFQQHLGHGLLAEIHEQRLVKARQLLIQTELKLEVIALECGFQSVQRFSAIFKARCGMAPGQFRLRNRSQLLPNRGL